MTLTYFVYKLEVRIVSAFLLLSSLALDGISE